MVHNYYCLHYFLSISFYVSIILIMFYNLFYNFHIGDYKSHTSHLSVIEDIAYRRLLDFYYLHEKPIKQHDIARQIGMREHEQDVLTILDEFFLSSPQGFIHPRADKEIARFKEFAEAGKRGAAKRWGANGEANSPPNPTPIATNNHKPITNNHKPNITTPDGVSDAVFKDYLEKSNIKFDFQLQYGKYDDYDFKIADKIVEVKSSGYKNSDDWL